jgi:dTDP-4-dehydrorhamnose 3,5-epimerase
MSAHVALEDDRLAALPDGVRVMPLTMHPDNRGDLTEIYRNEWHDTPLPVQWMVSRTKANVLRGVHAHARHWDYYCVAEGEIIVGVHDLRPAAVATRQSAMRRLTSRRLEMLVIPAGVAHGLYSPGDSLLIVGTSTYYNPADDGGCRWDAPELNLDWPCSTPELSARDREAGSYAELRTWLLTAAPTFDTAQR